jgi:hypothetical protein
MVLIRSCIFLGLHREGPERVEMDENGVSGLKPSFQGLPRFAPVVDIVDTSNTRQ